jgi:undecaprenyl-diphosphatase
MDLFLKPILLGILEGITEFLPISSTGHLIIVNRFMNFSGEFANMFNIVIQLGAILSVIVFFRDRIFPFSPSKTPLQRNEIWNLWKKTLAGVVPALIIGGLLGDVIEEKLFNPTVVASALVIGGILLIFVERTRKDHKFQTIGSMTYVTAVAIGFIQCIAMVPGTSRSAATILGAMLLGASRPLAAEFSFFLAIPTMTAASGYALMKTGIHLAPREWIALATGFVVSFLTAWGVIALFMNYIRKHSFEPFAYYRIILGIAVILYFSFARAG